MVYPRFTGENLNYAYDRNFSSKNFNLSGSLYASYGSNASWENKISETKTRDNYSIKRPMGLHAMELTLNLNFENISKFEAGILQKSIEQIKQQTSDTFTITYGNTTPINPNIGNVYLNLDHGENSSDRILDDIDGSYLSSVSFNAIENNSYNASASFIQDCYPAFFNISGIYIPSTNISNWSSSVTYSKFDIVYKDYFKNERDNFFYCLSDHTSSAGDDPLYESQYWTQDFFWEPDFSVNNSFETEGVQKSPMGFTERIKMNKNESLLNLSLRFSNRSNKETRSIIHFLENRMGYKRFKYSFNGLGRTYKVFSSPKWSVEFIYKNCNNINVDLIEEAMPLISRELNT